MSDRTIIRGLMMPSFEHVCGRLRVAKVMPRNAQTSEASATPARFKAQGAANE